MKITGVAVASLAHAAVAVGKDILAGDPVLTDKTEKEKRLSICEACDYRDNIQCSKCECSIIGISMIRSKHCPVQKF
ncbi:MAG: hypothetical protein M0Q93_00485 [Terrimicrobiaceae bacterium]|nr:hypothetical protein [Terrimicrobiaceae bacterium]